MHLLAVTHRPLDTVIELKSALFPATQLPADFVCTVHQPGNFGTLVELAFALGNFQGKVVAERWLAGLDPMKSVMTLDTPTCDLGASGHLSIRGHAQGTFFPDWRFEISAADLATIDGLAPLLTSDSFSLKLLKPGDPSLSSHPKSKRTHIGLTGAGKNWQLKPAILDLPIGQLHVADGLFDRIDIEAGEGAAGDIARVLAASSSRSDGLTLQLAGDATDLLGNPASLKMSHAIYAIAFDTSVERFAGRQRLAIGRFHKPHILALARRLRAPRRRRGQFPGGRGKRRSNSGALRAFASRRRRAHEGASRRERLRQPSARGRRYASAHCRRARRNPRLGYQHRT